MSSHPSVAARLLGLGLCLAGTSCFDPGEPSDGGGSPWEIDSPAATGITPEAGGTAGTEVGPAAGGDTPAAHDLPPGIDGETATQAAPTPSGWYDDLDAAQAVAKRDGKHLFVDFTGSGWCGWCARLDGEILSKPEFGEPVSEAFVFVRLDFDEAGAARKDCPHPGRNNRLKDDLGVTGFPTVVLMTADGKPYAERGYESGGPKPYAKDVLEQQSRAAEIDGRVAAAVARVPAARSAGEAVLAADQAAELLRDADGHPLAQPLMPIVGAILAADDVAPERERLAVHALAISGAADEEIVARAFQVDPRNADGIPEAALASAMKTVQDPDRVRGLVDRAETLLRTAPVFDRPKATQLYADCAFWCRNWLAEPDRSRAMARFALSLEPAEPRLRSMLEDLAAN